MLLDGACGGCGIQLVRVVKHRRLGRPRTAGLVVNRDRVQQLGPYLGLKSRRALLDEAQAQVDVTEQPSFLGRAERRAALQLGGAADVVQQGRRQHEIGPQPRMQLRCLTAERRHADRVLEQPARVGVVGLRGRQAA